MKNYEIRTQCDELIGAGDTVENAIKAALNKISVDDFIDYCTYCVETTDNIERFSMFDLHDIAIEHYEKERTI